MKPFDLEAAKRGDPIQTRDGRKARFIAHVPECYESYRVIAFIDGCATAAFFCEQGKHLISGSTNSDLFMAPKKRVVWVNLYYIATQQAYWYGSEESANANVRDHRIGNRAYPVEIDDE